MMGGVGAKSRITPNTTFTTTETPSSKWGRGVHPVILWKFFLDKIKILGGDYPQKVGELLRCVSPCLPMTSLLKVIISSVPKKEKKKISKTINAIVFFSEL